MNSPATAAPAPDFEFTPRQRKKDTFHLGNVPMPDSVGLEEGDRNELSVNVTYMKDGMRRQGRGIYLTVTGHSTDGTFQKHMLMQDPSEYILIEPAKRFSAKRLAEIAAATPESCRDAIAEQVARARAYYESKGR